MKKSLLVLFIALVFTGCQAKSYNPVIDTSFCYDAIFTTGDFSFSATIEKIENNVKITVNDTLAKGLVITYNGTDITFTKDSLTYTLDGDDIDKTNPAIIIFDVFSAMQNIDNLTVQKTKNGFEYVGKTSVCQFVFIQNDDNTYKSILIPDMDVTIEFETL